MTLQIAPFPSTLHQKRPLRKQTSTRCPAPLYHHSCVFRDKKSPLRLRAGGTSIHNTRGSTLLFLPSAVRRAEKPLIEMITVSPGRIGAARSWSSRGVWQEASTLRLSPDADLIFRLCGEDALCFPLWDKRSAVLVSSSLFLPEIITEKPKMSIPQNVYTVSAIRSAT